MPLHRRCPCAWPTSPLMAWSSLVTSPGRSSRCGGAPGTPSAWETPPAAPADRRLVLSGGFTVIDRQQRHLHDRVIAKGFADLDGYLVARCQQQASLAQLAGELATTTVVARRLL